MRLVTIARMRNVTEAHLARTILEQGGIEAVVGDEHTVWSNWFLLDAIGGVKLQVWEDDLPAALELLRQPPHAFPALAADAPVPGDEAAAETDAPLCPRCGAAGASFRDGAPEGFLIVWLEKLVPLPLLHGWWTCKECGKRWVE